MRTEIEDLGVPALGINAYRLALLPWFYCVGFCTPIYLRAGEFAVWRSMMETWVLFKSCHVRCSNCPNDTIEVKQHKGDVVIVCKKGDEIVHTIVVNKKVADTFFGVCSEFMEQINRR